MDNSAIDLDRVAQSLNYHGTFLLQEMTSNRPDSDSRNFNFLEIYQTLIETHKVDFKQTKRRVEKHNRPSQKEMDFDQCLRRFILEKSEILFKKAPTTTTVSEELQQRPSSSSLSRELRRGDVVYARVKSQDESGLIVKLLCTGGQYEKDIESYELEVFIPRYDIVSLEEEHSTTTSLESFHRNQYIRAMVTSVLVEDQKVNLTLRPPTTTLEGLEARKTELGVVTDLELPAYFLNAKKQTISSQQNYDRVLRRAAGFKNPSIEESLCAELGLENRGGYWPKSLLATIRSELKFGDKRVYSDSLRQEQTHKIAMKSVMKGIEKFKQGNQVAAMQHLNKALEIEENNAEGLVARGALYANQESFDLAISDFESALKLDPQHKNAKTYLIETLLTKARTYESRKKHRISRTAIDCYKKILIFCPDHDEATDRLDRLLDKKSINTDDKRKNRASKRKRSDSGSESSVECLDSREGVSVTEDTVKNSVDSPDKYAKHNGASTSSQHTDFAAEKDDNLAEKLKEYYEKYTHRNLSSKQQEELCESGLMGKLKEYYDKYQRRNSAPQDSEIEILKVERYANQESFVLAISDFESALKLDPEHKNAKTYLIETLLTKARTKTKLLKAYS